MLIEQQVKQFNALNEWFQTAQGLSVAEEISKQLKPVLDFLKGDILLQLNYCGENSWLGDLRFNKKWIATPFLNNNSDSIICSLTQIPLPRNSLDCIIAPLTNEPFIEGYRLIDEIDRILKPMGYVVFFSINPWSLWGAALKLGFVHCYSDKSLKLLTPFHLNRVFIQRGYRQCLLNNFYYIPPVNNKLLLKKLAFFNEVGKMLWPFPSGFYCYIAQKYEPITPSLIQAVKAEPLTEFNPTLQPTN